MKESLFQKRSVVCCLSMFVILATAWYRFGAILETVNGRNHLLQFVHQMSIQKRTTKEKRFTAMNFQAR